MTERATTPEPTTRSRVRMDALDGLRGLAIVLVVLSHGWQLWPTESIDANALVRPVFRSGNTAVTVFLVAAGFLTYRTLARREDLREMRLGVALVRRVLRVGPSLWLMLAVLALVSAIDTTDRSDVYDNGPSFGHVLTYTWNWYVQSNLMLSRPDFGHLWYLAVDMQAFVIMAVFMYVLRRHPVGLLWALGGFLLLLTWWRIHVTQTEFVFQVLVRTTARMDPFVVGVMLAAALPLLRRLPLDPLALRVTAVGSALALVPVTWYCSVDERFLTFGVTLLELDLAVLFGAVALGATAPWPLRAEILQVLGRNSLLLYIWHYPIFMLVSRHTIEWGWVPRTVLAFVLVGAVWFLAHRLVERRVTRLLAHPGWRRLDGGWGAAVAGWLRAGLERPTGDRAQEEQIVKSPAASKVSRNVAS